MALNLDSHELEIPCPKCHQKTKKSVGWLKVHSRFDCPKCHQSIEVDSKELFASLKKIEGALRNFGK